MKNLVCKIRKFIRDEKGISEFTQMIVIIPILIIMTCVLFDAFTLSTKWFATSSAINSAVRTLSIQGGYESSVPSSYPFNGYATGDNLQQAINASLEHAYIHSWRLIVDGVTVMDESGVSVASTDIPIRTTFNTTLEVDYDWSFMASIMPSLRGTHAVSRPGVSEWD